MPELPEAETVRRGMQRWFAGRTVASVDVHHERAVRDGDDPIALAVGLTGRRFTDVQRRGKFIWVVLDDGRACAIHLGMSGQVRVGPGGADDPHVRAELSFTDDGPPLQFVDQRTFGWLSVQPLVVSPDGRRVPKSVRDIGADLLEPAFDIAQVSRRFRRRSASVKSVLLDQNLASGVGNIYADEALWRVRRHWETPAERLRHRDVVALYAAATDVMAEALAAGGTSFDALYVDVNGRSGYFSRRLNVYGQAGRSCARCGRTIVRERFANRSSFRCPTCQRRSPRATRAAGRSRPNQSR